MLGGGAVAGAFGSLLGLGGGILIVPLLTLGFGLPLREAVGVSLVAVIMTSSAAAGVYLERHVANLRLGMSLELFTATGALVGGSIAFLLDERVLEFLFAILLAYVAISMIRGRGAKEDDGPAEAAVADEPPEASEPAETTTGAAASARAPGDPGAAVDAALSKLDGPGYSVRNLPLGVVGSLGAGLISA